MTLTVSISDLRSNLANYLTQVSNGTNLLVRDEKKDVTVAELVGKKQFDPEAFSETLDRVAGIFTAENHPEWATKKDVTNWLIKTRKNFDRKF